MTKKSWDWGQLLYYEYLSDRRDSELERLPPYVPMDEVDDVPPLDNDWGLEELTVGEPLSAESVPLYKEVQDLRTALGSSVTRNIKDILVIARENVSASRELGVARSRVRVLE